MCRKVVDFVESKHRICKNSVKVVISNKLLVVCICFCFCFQEQEVIEEEYTVHIHRQPGMGLGISIAGGKGSTPFKGEDEVNTLFKHSDFESLHICKDKSRQKT